VQTQLSDLHIELKRLSTKLDSSSSLVATSGVPRSPLPEGRRVSFDVNRREQSPARQQSTFNRRGDDPSSRMSRETAAYSARQERPFVDSRGQQNRTSGSQPSYCNRCGSRYCTSEHPLYCRFANMRCYFCNRTGQNVCQQRLRTQNSQY